MDSTSSFCPHVQQRLASVNLHSSQVSLHLAVNSFNLEESTRKEGKKAPTWGPKCSPSTVHKYK